MDAQRKLLRHLVTLLGGTAAGQIIALFASPFLTRLYSPSDFAIVTAFVGLSALLSVVATLRYDLAVLLPKEERDAEIVCALAFAVLLAMSVISGAFLWAVGDALIRFLPTFQVVKPVLMLLAPMMFVLGCTQLLNAWANRHRGYRVMAAATMAGQGGNALIAVSLGCLKIAFNGLVLGRLLGQTSAAIVLMLGLRAQLPRPTCNLADIKRVAWRFRQFPFFNVPYSLLGILSQEFLVFALLAYQFGEAAGYFALVRTVLLMPARYLSASLGQVFFREAAQLFGTPKLEEMTLGIMRRISGPVIPALVFFMFWSGPVFEFAFGQQWAEAGRIAAFYAPVAFLFLFTSWPERLYEVSERQQISLVIEFAGNLLKLAVVLSLLAGGYGAIGAIVGYAVADGIYHVTYLLGLFHVGRFKTSRLIALAGQVLLLAAPCALTCALINQTPLPAFAQAGLALLLMGGMTVYGTIQGLKRSHQS